MERPSTRELEYFIAVAEELNFSRAAARLHLTQPPLSRQIKALEEKLGVVLLDRNTQSVALTAAGILFLEDARQILRQIDRAAASARTMVRGQAGRLNIGFVGATLEDRMTRVLRQFRYDHPQLQVRLQEMTVPDLLDALREKQIDGAFIGSAPTRMPKGFRLTLWRMEPAWIVVSREHRLADREGVHLRDLERESWIALARESSPAYYRQFVQWCEEEGFTPSVVSEPNRVSALLAMVAVGEGISLVSDAVAQASRGSPELHFLSLLSPWAILVHVFVCREEDNSPALNDFLAVVEAESGQ